MGPGSRRQRPHPWGEQPADGSVANLDQLAFGCAPAGAYPGGESPCGMRQTTGDVWEWTASGFEAYRGFERSPTRSTRRSSSAGPFRVLRGGAWATQPDAVSNTFRNWDHPERRQIFAGFRCARTGGRRERVTAERGPDPVQIDVHLRDGTLASLADDVRTACRDPKAIPPKYFYDARGSELSSRSPSCPSTTRRGSSSRSSTQRAPRSSSWCDRRRSSSSAPGRRARPMRSCGPMMEGGCGRRYVPVDVSECAVEQCAERLAARVRGPRDPRRRGRLRAPPRPLPPAAGRRLIAFLGGTIGNLDEPERRRLLRRCGRSSAPRPPAGRHRPRQGPRAARGRLQRLGRRDRRVQPQHAARHQREPRRRPRPGRASSTSPSTTSTSAASRCGCARART